MELKAEGGYGSIQISPSEYICLLRWVSNAGAAGFESALEEYESPSLSRLAYAPVSLQGLLLQQELLSTYPIKFISPRQPDCLERCSSSYKLASGMKSVSSEAGCSSSCCWGSACGRGCPSSVVRW